MSNEMTILGCNLPRLLRTLPFFFSAYCLGIMRRLFQSGDIPFTIPGISQHQSADLEVMLSMQKVKDVVFQLDKASAAGPDGFSVLFYQVYWNIIHED